MNTNCCLNCFKNYILGKEAPLITDEQKKEKRYFTFRNHLISLRLVGGWI